MKERTSSNVTMTDDSHQSRLIGIDLFETDSGLNENECTNLFKVTKHSSLICLSCSTSDYLFVEDLLMTVLRTLKIGPVYRNIFGLKFVDLDVWSAPQTKIDELIEEYKQALESDTLEQKFRKTKLGNNETSFGLHLELRMRFRPSNYDMLWHLDPHAHEYIIAQCRYEFMNKYLKLSKNSSNNFPDSMSPIALGLITIDICIHIKKNDMSMEQVEEMNFHDYIPKKSTYIQKKLLDVTRKKILVNIKKMLYEDQTCITVLKNSYLEAFFNLMNDFTLEVYRVCQNDDKRLDVRVNYIQSHDINSPNCFIETNENLEHENWTNFDSVEDISVGMLKKDERVVEIRWMSGKIMKIYFESLLCAKSFLSLLDGYYRLLKKWAFNFCSELTSFNLEFLKSMKSHGPIGYETSHAKLSLVKERGTYVIRQSRRRYDVFKIDIVNGIFQTITIAVYYNSNDKKFTKINHKFRYDLKDNFKPKVLLDEDYYRTLDELVNDLQVEAYDSEGELIQAKHCIMPYDCDDYPKLLLSLPEQRLDKLSCVGSYKMHVDSISLLPRAVPRSLIKIDRSVRQDVKSKYLRVTYAKLFNVKSVVSKSIRVKRSLKFDKDKYSPQAIIKAQITSWLFVSHSHIAEIIGVEPQSLALIEERFDKPPLDKFIESHDSDFKTHHKVIVASQLSSALMYLQTKGLNHGKIRCHNIFIKNTSPFQITLSDPLGIPDIYEDRAFFPPECSHYKSIPTTYEYGLDVWAFGTTIWQMFNSGKKPAPNVSANELELMNLNVCSPLRRIVTKCWQINPVNRIQPRTIYRDLTNECWTESSDYYSASRLVATGDQISDVTDAPSDTSATTCDNGIRASFETFDSRSSSENSHDASTKEDNMILTFKNHKSTPKVVDDGFNYTLRKLLKGNILKKLPFHQKSASKQNSLRYQQQKNQDTQSDSTIPENSIATLEIGNKISCRYLLRNQIDMSSKIGIGIGGSVYKAVFHDRGTEKFVAVKIPSSSENYSKSDLLREANILNKLNNKNIVSMIGLIDEDEPSLVMEFVPLGSLLHVLRNSPESDLPNLPLEEYTRNIASGMKYLQLKHIIHRDLALRNILLHNHTTVKICDFGLACYSDETIVPLSNDRHLPIKWYAPESLEFQIFSHKTDVWSFAVVIWEIYSGGFTPQYPCKIVNILSTIKSGTILLKPRACPDAMYELMKQCWNLKPEERIDFVDICEQLNIEDSESEASNSQDGEFSESTNICQMSNDQAGSTVDSLRMTDEFNSQHLPCNGHSLIYTLT